MTSNLILIVKSMSTNEYGIKMVETMMFNPIENNQYEAITQKYYFCAEIIKVI